MLAVVQSSAPLPPRHHNASLSYPTGSRSSTSSLTCSTVSSMPSDSKRSTAAASPSGPKSSTNGQDSGSTSKGTFNVSANATPGLLTLSKPSKSLESSSNSRKSSRPSRPTRANQGPTVEAGMDSISENTLVKSRPNPKHKVPPSARSAVMADESQLSQSAPTSLQQDNQGLRPRGTAGEWGMPNSSGTREVLNWQQQLAANAKSNSRPASTSKKSKKVQSQQQRAHTPTSTAAPSEALTWQQELLNPSSAAKRGPHFDVFADSRDAETFGEKDSSVGRQRSGSVGDASKQRSRIATKKGLPKSSLTKSVGDLSIDDVFNNATSSGPSTPAKNKAKGHSTSSPALNLATQKALNVPQNNGEAAYAGPQFHNSPSAASLPAPKFGNRTNKIAAAELQRTGSQNSGTSSSDEGDRSMPRPARGERGATAPPAPMTSVSGTSQNREDGTPAARSEKAATIENLLAKLMGGGTA